MRDDEECSKVGCFDLRTGVAPRPERELGATPHGATPPLGAPRQRRGRTSWGPRRRPRLRASWRRPRRTCGRGAGRALVSTARGERLGRIRRVAQLHATLAGAAPTDCAAINLNHMCHLVHGLKTHRDSRRSTICWKLAGTSTTVHCSPCGAARAGRVARGNASAGRTTAAKARGGPLCVGKRPGNTHRQRQEQEAPPAAAQEACKVTAPPLPPLVRRPEATP
jgi:hypothetical protein